MVMARIILDLLRVVGATRAGSLILCVAIEDELVDVGERGELRFWAGIGTRSVRDGSFTHHAPESGGSASTPKLPACSNGARCDPRALAAAHRVSLPA